MIIIKPENISELSPVFQKGIYIKVRTGCSLKILLCDILEIPQDYVLNRISTIFLDGKPVDQLDSAIIRDHSVLSLSAAMPGLVGAVMRRGGTLASFRDSISYRQKNNEIDSSEGIITVKLFNIMIAELAGYFLRKGFFVKSSDIEDIFPDQLDLGKDSDMIFVCTNPF